MKRELEVVKVTFEEFGIRRLAWSVVGEARVVLFAHAIVGQNPFGVHVVVFVRIKYHGFLGQNDDDCARQHHNRQQRRKGALLLHFQESSEDTIYDLLDDFESIPKTLFLFILD